MLNNTITNTLLVKKTIANTTARRITGEDVGAENFAKWKTACENLHRECYKYERTKVMYALDRVDDINATNVFNALKVVLDLLGEVNGCPIERNQTMLDMVSHFAITRKAELVGRAGELKSELDIVKKQLKEVSTGMNPDYVAGLEEKFEVLTEELRIAKKQTESANPYPSIVSFNTFRGKLEDELVAIIEKQEAKSWEEIEAEKAAKKEASKAKRKANKQAKRQAEAKAKAEANA